MFLRIYRITTSRLRPDWHTWVRGHAESFYASDVRDEKGNSVPETELGRAIGKGEALYIGSAWDALGEQHYAPLRPGEPRTNQIHLNKLYDLSKPGKYTVQVQFLDNDAVGAKSNTIAITITK